MVVEHTNMSGSEEIPAEQEPQDGFANLILQGLRAINRDVERNRQRDEKLQGCLKRSVRALHEFLDDPERVAAYNAHVDKIIAAYQTENDTYEHYETKNLQLLKTAFINSSTHFSIFSARICADW